MTYQSTRSWKLFSIGPAGKILERYDKSHKACPLGRGACSLENAVSAPEAGVKHNSNQHSVQLKLVELSVLVLPLRAHDYM